MPEEPKWKRFEKLAAEIQRELAPHNAQVTQNERVPGIITQVPRQLDITVRIPTDVGEFLMVVECKDLATPVDVKDVEAFVGMLGDLSANKGAVVSAVGFTAAAKRRAEAAGIQAWTLVDVESADWPSYVAIPVLIDEAVPLCAFIFSSTSPAFELRLADVSDVVLYDSDKLQASLGTPRTLFARWWNDGDYDLDTVDAQEVALHAGPAFLRSSRGAAEVRVAARVKLDHKLRFGEVPLAQLRGLAEPDMRTIRTRRFTTDWINFAEVERTWRVLASRDELAVQPLLEFATSAVLATDTS